MWSTENLSGVGTHHFVSQRVSDYTDALIQRYAPHTARAANSEHMRFIAAIAILCIFNYFFFCCSSCLLLVVAPQTDTLVAACICCWPPPPIPFTQWTIDMMFSLVAVMCGMHAKIQKFDQPFVVRYCRCAFIEPRLRCVDRPQLAASHFALLFNFPTKI